MTKKTNENEVTEEKVEVKEEQVSVLKKKSSKKIIIIVVIILVLALLGVGGFFVYNWWQDIPNSKDGIEEEPKISEVWGEVYFAYLKKSKKDEKFSDIGLSDNMENAKIKFIEVDSVKEPVMQISYTKNKKDYSNIYYIEDEKVNALTFSESVSVDLLYNIEDEEYEYYLHNKDGKEDNYTSLDQHLEDVLDGNRTTIIEYEYTFKEDDVITATNDNGKEISLSKFDETFVEVETEEGLDFSTDLKNSAIKDLIQETVDNYKPKKEVVSEEIKKEVEEKVDEIIAKKDEIKEIEKAKEEKLKNNEVVYEDDKALFGEYSLEYGTYVNNISNKEILGGDYIINKDKTYTYTGDGYEDKESGKYEIELTCEIDPATGGCYGKKFWTIVFYKANGTEVREPFKLGNNSFEGVQYLNQYKLKK